MKTRTATTGCITLALAAGAALGQPPATQPAAPSEEAATLEAPPPVMPKPGTGGGPPPPYTPMRWNEDYSYLKDPSKRTDFFDPVKYVPLNEEGDWWASFGGQARYRYEFFDDFNFDAPNQQDRDGFHMLRLLYYADLHFGPNVRAFVHVIDAWADGREPGERPGLDENDFDLHQGFVDVKFPLPMGDGGSVTLRGGRQNLLYGAQRLISPLDWTNTRRTFDGAKASVAFPGGRNTLDLFAVHPVVVDEGPLDSFTDDQMFYGAYNTLSLPDLIEGGGAKLDAYLLYLDKFSATFAQGAGDEERWTVGGRLSANPKPWDFDVEAAFQFGEFGEGDIFAYMLAAEGGYTFADVSLTPRLYLGFDLASGDDDPDDDDLETFNQLFPLGHAFFGYIDVIGRQNIIDLHPGVELTLLQNARYVKKMTLRADYHLFWRESGDDAIYGVGGQIIRADNDSGERSVGSELDLLLNWQIDRHLSAYFGYSHFFPGEFIDDTGPSKDIDFVYAAVQFTF